MPATKLVFTLFLGMVIASPITQFCQISPTSTPPPEYISNVLGTDCEKPCWEGIAPGYTTLEDALIILNDLPFFNAAPEQFIDTEIQLDGIERTIIRWRYQTIAGQNRIEVIDGIVTEVRVVTPLEISLSEIIDLYGQPEGLQLVYEVGAEVVHLRIGLVAYYPKIGLMTEFRVFEDNVPFIDSAVIDGNIPLTTFWLVEPAETLQEFVKPIRPYLSFLLLEGWPGIGTEIINNRKNFAHSFPTLVTTDGEFCCVLEASDNLPRWMIFNSW